ncbi:N-acetylmuramoyl-L-alanine amidase [Flavobacterium sp. W22_SRS_FK3]|uniref:N-acetylmuramoyl-L-alanine amidase family protein n=1 Tax=Flavobacterium sp. W22_SRS_FK3 TaxID=3240275 RepID=UPI003F93E56E
MKTGIIVIDPGHGGTENIGGSDANHAVSALGDLEKNLTLEICKLLVIELQLKKHQTFLTRESDINLSLRDRANLAKSTNADVFISIHFNGWNDTTTQGTETYVHLEANKDSALLASFIQQRLVSVTKYKDRGVKAMQLGVLNPTYHLSKTTCVLAEISFITETKDAQRLRDMNYKKSIASALAIAINNYINRQSSITIYKVQKISSLTKEEDIDI